MLKVLHIMEPCEGGTSRYLMNLVSEEIKSGHAVSIFYSSRRIAEDFRLFLAKIKARGGSIYDMKIPRYPVIKDIFIVFKLLYFYKKNKIDIVNAHSSKAGGIIRLAKLLNSSLNAVYTPHAYFGMSRDNKLKTRFFDYIEKLLATVCPKIHNSEAEDLYSKNDLSAAHTTSIVIAQPIDTESFNGCQKPDIQEGRKKCILWFGRLEYQKAADIIFPLLYELLKKRPDLSLLVGGWGTLSSELERFSDPLIKDRFEYVGRINDPKPLYEKSDIVLVTSRYEAGIPFVAVEALLSKRALVYNLAPGVSEIHMLKNVLALEFELNSLSSLEDSINLALSKIPVVDFDMQANSVSKIFDKKSQALKIMDYYKKVIDLNKT